MTGVSPGREFTIYVTHVEADGPLLRIWGQINKEAATNIETKIFSLTEQFKIGQGSIFSDSVLIPDTVCCAYHEDGYYRAKIGRAHPPQDKVFVHFMDYGNKEIVPYTSIRLINDTREGIELQTLGAVCTDFILIDVLPLGPLWSPKIIEHIKHAIRYNELPAIVCSVHKRMKMLKLNYQGRDFCEWMVNERMARPATMEDLLRIIEPPVAAPSPQFNQHYPGRPRHFHQSHQQHDQNTYNNNFYQNQNQKQKPLNNRGPENWRQPHHHPQHPQHPQQQPLYNPPKSTPPLPRPLSKPLSQSLVFTGRVLKEHKKYNVLVSFVEEGPLKFAVQPEENLQELEDLMKRISSFPVQPLSSPPIPSSVCLGRNSTDGVLRRAVVSCLTNTLEAKVFYIDYGSSEILSHSDIYELPLEFANPSVLSVRFTLSSVRYLIVSDEMKKYFKNLVEGKHLVLEVVPPEDSPLYQYGHLYDGDKNILEMLIAKFPSCTENWPDARRLPRGAKKTVHVSYVEACSKFFVQLDEDTKALEKITSVLNESIKTASLVKLGSIKIGYKCLAHCNVDGQWYRAQITGIAGTQVFVHYVDFGNDEKIPMSSLRTVGGNVLTRIPALAIHCVLSGFEGKPYNPEVDDKFEAMVLDKAIELGVLEVHGSSIVVDVYDRSTLPIVNVSAELRIITENGNAGGGVKSGEKAASPARRGKSEENERPKPSSDQSSFEKPKKSWKDEENEQKRHEMQNHRQMNQSTSPQQNDRFNRDTRNDRSNRDNSMRQDRNDNYERFNADANNRNRDTRGNRGKPTTPPSRGDRSRSTEKTWSDRDSDTSSRGGRQGDRGGRGSGDRRRDNFRASPREFEENERNFRSTKTNNFNASGRGPRDQSAGNSRRSSDPKDSRKPKIDTWTAPPTSPPKPPQPLRIPPANITLGATKTCELVFIVSPLDFSVQLLPDVEELDILMEKITQLYETGGKIIPEASIIPGLDCVAQYSVDSKWYRARVHSLEPPGATVHFVDYGNAEIVPLDKIKELQQEISRLPAQSVRCKLLAAVQKPWTPSELEEFSSKLDLKLLEAEFVGLEDAIYEILVREIVDGVPKTHYINEDYSEGADLTAAKELSRNKSRKTAQNSRKPHKELQDYASLDAKWKEPVIDLDVKQEIMVTWMRNPSVFYCQSMKKQAEFRAMMNDIQNVYSGRQPVNEALQVGTAVMAVFADDGALYRAEILELNKLKGNIVRYVDFGNSAMVETRQTFRVEKKFMELPKQAINCTLKNIVPANSGNWSKSNSHEIEKLFNTEKMICTVHEVQEGKFTVSLDIEGRDVAGILVEKGLADFAAASNLVEVAAPISEQNCLRIDISRLVGQFLRVKVSNFESGKQFHVQLPSAADSERNVSSFMADKNPEVLPKLLQREIFLGSGCLINTVNGWQRAVVINTSRTNGIDVRLIDTGAKQIIQMDCMLTLPSQLAVMQNQAVECYVKNTTSDTRSDKEFKEKIENKEVIIRVENIDNNRLEVSLFSTSGQALLTASPTTEQICPILPMLLLNTVEKVTVSHINHSQSIFLQRSTDLATIQSFLEDLYAFYSTSGTPLVITPDALCAAQSDDENWYRAKVTKKTASGAIVQYLDYGNTEEVPTDRLKQLNPDFIKNPQLAIEVSLSFSLKGSQSEQLELLTPHLMDKEFTASFHSIRGKWTVKLESETGEKLSEILAASILEVPKKPEVDPNEPEDLIVGSRYKVSVTHADDPGQFWIQRLRDAQAIEELQDKLQSEISTYPRIEGTPEENLFCAAVYSGDRLWYRAEIIDADEELATVRFVDIGNTDSIMLTTSEIKHLPDSLKSVKRYGIKCKLDLIPAGEVEWPEIACEKFKALTSSEKYLDAVVVADGNPNRVELFIDSKNIGDRLVEENVAIRSSGDDGPEEFEERDIDPRSAFVSHINSPSEFWVQEEKFVAELETIVDRFIMADMLPKIDDVREGMLCVARFPEDESWYRAQVISHGDTGTNVIYIDYGNSAVSTEIRQIPDDLAALPPFSRKCCLPLPDNVEHWSERACEEFSKMADDGRTIFILEVIEEGETSKVRLIFEGRDIAEPLTGLCEKPLPIIEERLSPLGEETSPNVVVSHVVSPAEFWIQADYKMAELDKMTELLADAASYLPLTSSDEGIICAAQFPEDGQWYRAKILCSSESEIEVLYIDYGNSAVTSELRALPEDIIKIPALSMFSSLRLPEGLECWSNEACEAFIELVADGATMFEYEEIGEDDPSVISLFLNGEDVVEILAPLCKMKGVDETIDAELRQEAEKIQNLRDSAFDETQTEISGHGGVIVSAEVDQSESIEGTSSSTSGIEVAGASDQSTTSIKFDSSVEGLEVRVKQELTADDIVELYAKAPSETSGDAEEVAKDAENVSKDAEKVFKDAEEVSKDAEEVISDAGKVSKDAEEVSEAAEEVSGDAEKVSEDAEKASKDSEEKNEAVVREAIPEDGEKAAIEEKGHLQKTDKSEVSEEERVLEEKSVVSQEKEENSNTSEEKEQSLLHQETSAEKKVSVKEEVDDLEDTLEMKSNISASSSGKLSLDLSKVLDTEENDDAPKSPGTPKTPHSEKIVAGVVTDHQLLQEDKKSDNDTIEAHSISI